MGPGGDLGEGFQALILLDLIMGRTRKDETLFVLRARITDREILTCSAANGNSVAANAFLGD